MENIREEISKSIAETTLTEPQDRLYDVNGHTHNKVVEGVRLVVDEEIYIRSYDLIIHNIGV